MKLRILILLELLIVANILYAQTDYRPGYIISNNGDTVFGVIDYRSDTKLSRVCKFKGFDNIINEYSPNDIFGFRFIDSKFYISREVNNNKVFLEYLIKGKVSIYYLRDGSGDHYYIDKENEKLTELPYEEGIITVDNKQVYYASKQHLGYLSYYMQDAPGFKTRIQSVKEPNHQTLIHIAKEYHNAVCKDEQCIIYEKPAPYIKLFPEFSLGMVDYYNVPELNDKIYFHTSLIGHFWMPRVNEKMYFRTGLSYMQLYFEEEKINYYKIPCQIEYIYPKGVFRPRMAYGFNFYLPFSQTVSFDLGANIKLSESYFLSVSSDIEFNSIMMVFPREYLSYSLQLGLFMNIK